MRQSVNPIKITLGDKLGVFFWRSIAMPAIAVIGGKKYPSGKVTEFAYGDLPDEKLDFIVPSQTLEKRLAIVHIHGGAWIAGSKGNLAMMLGVFMSNPELLRQ